MPGPLRLGAGFPHRLGVLGRWRRCFSGLPVPGWSQCQQRAGAWHPGALHNHGACHPMRLPFQEQLPTSLLMGMGRSWSTQPVGILTTVNVCSEEQTRSCWAQQGSLGSGLFCSITLPPDAWRCAGRALELDVTAVSEKECQKTHPGTSSDGFISLQLENY